MTLKWSDVDELAQALEDRFPQTDLSVLEYDELKKMVAAVDEFKDETNPDENDMENVINSWIYIQFPDDPEKVPSGKVQ